MDELRERMTGIEDPRHASYVRYPLVDILLIVMCGVLSGLDRECFIRRFYIEFLSSSPFWEPG